MGSEGPGACGGHRKDSGYDRQRGEQELQGVGGYCNGKARLCWCLRAGKKLGILEKSQKLGYFWGNPSNSTRPKKTLILSKVHGD